MHNRHTPGLRLSPGRDTHSARCRTARGTTTSINLSEQNRGRPPSRQATEPRFGVKPVGRQKHATGAGELSDHKHTGHNHSGERNVCGRDSCKRTGSVRMSCTRHKRVGVHHGYPLGESVGMHKEVVSAKEQCENHQQPRCNSSLSLNFHQ